MHAYVYTHMHVHTHVCKQVTKQALKCQVSQGNLELEKLTKPRVESSLKLENCQGRLLRVGEWTLGFRDLSQVGGCRRC